MSLSPISGTDDFTTRCLVLFDNRSVKVAKHVEVALGFDQRPPSLIVVGVDETIQAV